jgi:hypothetical protein
LGGAWHAKDQHDLLTKGPSMVNVLGCGKDEEEEGWLIVISGEDDPVPKGRGWRTLNDSWLEMEQDDEEKIFHVSVVLGIGESNIKIALDCLFKGSILNQAVFWTCHFQRLLI